MKVHWTDRAKKRLRLIHDYIAQDAPLVAKQTTTRLLLRSAQIGTLPQSGREVPKEGLIHSDLPVVQGRTAKINCS